MQSELLCRALKYPTFITPFPALVATASRKVDISCVFAVSKTYATVTVVLVYLIVINRNFLLSTLLTSLWPMMGFTKIATPPKELRSEWIVGEVLYSLNGSTSSCSLLLIHVSLSRSMRVLSSSARIRSCFRFISLVFLAINFVIFSSCLIVVDLFIFVNSFSSFFLSFSLWLMMVLFRLFGPFTVGTDFMLSLRFRLAYGFHGDVLLKVSFLICLVILGWLYPSFVFWFPVGDVIIISALAGSVGVFSLRSVVSVTVLSSSSAVSLVNVKNIVAVLFPHGCMHVFICLMTCFAASNDEHVRLRCVFRLFLSKILWLWRWIIPITLSVVISRSAS